MAKKVPEHVKVRSKIVLHSIEMVKDQGAVCPRCDGEGYLERDDWIVTDDDGRRACFKCKGTGTYERTYAHPIKVRYAVANRLKALIRAGNVDKIEQERDDAFKDVYWPILEDVFSKALAVVSSTDNFCD